MHESTEAALELTGPDPRARALLWYLDHLRSGWQKVSEDEIRRIYRSDDPIEPSQRLAFLRALEKNLAGIEVVGAVSRGPLVAVLRLRDDRGRPWRVCGIFHRPEPERLRWAVLTQEAGPGVRIRRATPADGKALAELERRVPVVDGEMRRSYDRGDDYLLATDTPYQEFVHVAEVDGELRGMSCGVRHPARAAGRSLALQYNRHLRIDPAVRKRGVFSALSGVGAEAAIPHCDAPWSLTTIANAAVNRLGFEHVAHASAFQLRIDTRAHAVPAALRTARPEDAAALATLFERSTGALELSRGWTAADASERMTGAGHRYGWERIAFSEAAALGVERGGVRVVTESPAGREERREVLACDVAALPGREAELVPLVRAWCARLADEGIDDLLVTLAHRPLLDALAPLASRSIAFNLNHQFRVAPDAAARGYFIDGMLF
jgi:hypothetical protein